MAGPAYNQSVITQMIREAIEHQPRGAATRLAETLGVRPQTVSKWVKGDTVPRMEDWPKIEEALGMEPRTFHDAAFGATKPDRLDAIEAELAEIRKLIQELAQDVRDQMAPGNGPARGRSAR